MRLDPKRLEQRAIDVILAAWPRIISAIHAGTPVGAGFGSSRFSSPSQAFRVLYAAHDFPTAFAEAVVRDRFEGKQRRFLYRPYLDTLMVTQIGSTAPLRLIDLTAGGAYALGIDTDASRARTYTMGQLFSQALHEETTFDGILFDSRLTARQCIAIYDRAFARVTAERPVELCRVAAFPAEIKRLGITVRSRRGL